MTSSYLNHTRSIAELDVIIEKDRVAAFLIVKVQLEENVILCIAKIDSTREISLARIVSESEISAERIAASAEISTARLGARFEIIQSEIAKLDRTDINPHELEITVAMLNESSRQHTDELAEEAKKRIVDLKRETTDTISRIKKNVADSTAEIKRMKTATIEQNSKAAAIAHQKLLASKSQNRTRDQIAHEADDATELVLSTAEVSRTEMESKSALAIEHIRVSMKTAQKKIKFICDSAVERLEAARIAAVTQLESVINDRLAGLG